MARYVIRRILIMIPLLFGITLMVFVIINLAPGSPMAEFEANPRMSPKDIERIANNLGLNEPWYKRYAIWVSNLLRGDLGYSYINGASVTKQILTVLPNTLLLTLSATLFALVFAIPLGILSATRQYSALDNGVTVGSFIGLALPNFWLALLLQIWLSVELGWLPTISTGQAAAPFPERLKFFVLPVIVLALPNIAYFARFMRSAMLEVLRQDYIRTARAKGQRERLVVARHALKNAFIPVITVIGLQMGGLLGGAVVIEQIFGLPGIGWLILNAIYQRDYPVVQGGVFFVAIVFVLINLIVDLIYAYVDPRIRYT